MVRPSPRQGKDPTIQSIRISRSCFHGVLVLVVSLLLLLVGAGVVPPLELEPIQVRLELVALDHRKVLPLSDECHAPVLLRQLSIPPHAPHECPEGVHDQVVLARLGEFVQVLLEVRPSALRPGTDGRGVALVDVSRGAGLVNVRPALVVARQEQAHAVRPADVGLRGPLVPVGQVGGDPPRGHGRAVDVLVVEALVPHPLRERAGVRREPGDAYPEVVVDLEYLLLVGRELGHGPLERADHRVRVGPEGYARRSLLYRLHRVFDLEQPPFGRPHRHVGVVHIPEHLGGALGLIPSPCLPLPSKLFRPTSTRC
mmetsp:Transcript_35856/g.85484  ORF Transcript_35856/g.85484 Transcript_35856/m.85484 type:complete len:313 (-) Transcript_35856:36-974(-)